MNNGHVTDIKNARLSLEAARRKVEAEITTYPRPIAGCDAQFNHLLAIRERVAMALRALRDDQVK
jgi:hypothetical protein